MDIDDDDNSNDLDTPGGVEESTEKVSEETAEELDAGEKYDLSPAGMVSDFRLLQDSN